MATLEFKSFNGFVLTIDDKPIQQFYSQKAKALFIYLAIEFPRQHERSHLAGLLWPDYTEKRARRNLSQTFASLRKDLGDGEKNIPFFNTSTQTIGLNPDLNLMVDVLELQHLLQLIREHQHADPKTCDRCTAQLQTAVSLYQGPFLDQFGAVDSPLYEAWVIAQKEQIEQQAIEMMGRLSSNLEAQQKYEAAQQVNERLLKISPWLESAHQLQMRLFAQQGQRIQALNQYEQLSDVLMSELGVAPSEETNALYDAIESGEFKIEPSTRVTTPQEEPSSQPIPKPEFHGPKRPSLVGRQDELDIILTHFQEPNTRLVSLIGPGGIGKTHLSIEAAKQLLEQSEQFEDGAYFVDLAATETAVQLITQIASALQLSFSGILPPKAQLIDQLQEKQLLLVLDNFEQLIDDGADTVGDLLAETSGVRFLITSREPLNLMEEWQVKIDGLAYPRETAVFPQDTPYLQLASPDQEVHKYPSVTLFVERARQVDPKFSLVGEREREQAVLQICSLLEGHPLGIELAAPWVRMMSCQEIVQEIKNSINILASKNRNVLARHRSIRAVFEQSWKQLTTVEQTLLAKLSVFAGPFRRESAVEICRATLYSLVTLVDKSLLQSNPNGTYRLHKLLQQFTTEKHEEFGETTIHHDHAHYYSDRLNTLEPDIAGAKQTETLTQIESEIENIRQAWVWLVQHNKVEALIRCYYPLYNYHAIRGRHFEGKALFETAVHHLTQSSQKAITLNEQAIALFAFLHARLGEFYYALGLLSKAEAQFQEGIEYNRQIQSDQELAHCYYMLGSTKRLLGQFAGAKIWLLEASAILDREKEAHLYGFLCMSIGVVEKELGNSAHAKQYLNQSLAQFEKLNYQFGLAHVLRHLGTVAVLEDDPIVAQDFFEQSLQICREIGTKGGEAMALNQLGKLHQKSGDVKAAQAMFQEGLDLGNDSQETIVQIRTMNSLGHLKNQQGHYIEANTYLLEALSKSAKAEAIPEALNIVIEMAEGFFLQGNSNKAHPLVQLALDHPASSWEVQKEAQQLQHKLPALEASNSQLLGSDNATNSLLSLLEKSIQK